MSESAPAVEDESAEGGYEANARQDETDQGFENSGASAAPDEVLLPNAQPLVEASGGAAELTIERPRPRTVVPPQPIPLSGSSAGAVGTEPQVAQHKVVKPLDASPTIATLPRKGAEATPRPDAETVARPAALGEPKPYAVLGALAWTLRGAAAIVGVAGVLAGLADGSGESSRGILGGRVVMGLVVAVTVWTVGEMAAVVRDIARQQTRQ